MITLKSSREIDIMKQAGRIVAECHRLLSGYVRPGVTTAELNRIAEKHIRKRGAIPSFKGHQGFPASICVATNDVICHGIPDSTKLKSGDVITIDIGAYYRGYHGDSAWTYSVGRVSPKIKNLMKVAKQSMYNAIKQARVGNRIGDIGHEIQTYVESHNYGVVREYCGHGVGRNLWESPDVPHFGSPNRGMKIQEGMVFTIEPMITMGDWRAKKGKDGWTVRTVDGSTCVQYEHTIAVTPNRTIILTEL